MNSSAFAWRGTLFILFALQVPVVPHGIAAESVVRSPVSPTDSIRHFVVPEGLKVELVAHEPDVVDPVAIRFDEDGRMWVVQMQDYPTASASGHQLRSRISVLRDRDGDGFYETARVFADDLHYATGVQPWKGGVFVTMAGQVAYMKDTDGDSKANVVETWYTGFAQKNTQLRANHPRLALDNHIYVANGLLGGEIVDARRPDAKPVSISGMDFRFDPLTGEFEPVSGVGQFGLTFDDYGNRFVCSNRNPVIHIVLEDRYVKKNPLFAAAAVSTDVAKAGAESRVYSIARAWTTSHLHAGQFTAACSVEIYRGGALPAEYHGNVFVCEPTAHLVHREIIKPHGVTFISSPAPPPSDRQKGDGESAGVEFLASRDEWFSPVNLDVGPDGALYVVDMYRAVIEHPDWMPSELRERPDLTHGNDCGRIYRIVPVGFDRPKSPQLSVMPTKSLVRLLAHPNAWWREAAARLLLERQDKSVAKQLEDIALQHHSSVARVHALRLLESLDLLRSDLLVRLLRDSDARVVEQAIIAAESRLRKLSGLRAHVSELVAHDDARVRFQALLAATPIPSPPTSPADRWELDAMLIASGDRGGTVLTSMLQQPAAMEAHVADPKQFVANLAQLAAASNDDRQHTIAIEALLHSPAWGRAGLSAFFAEATRGGESLESLLARTSETTRDELEEVLNETYVDAANPTLAADVRCEAIDLVAFRTDSAEVLFQLACDDPNQAVRLCAIAALDKSERLQPWRHLLDQFSQETPVIQRAILDRCFTSADRTQLVLDEIEAGRIKPTELDATHAKHLVNHGDIKIQQRAQILFADALPADREQALAKYRVALTMTPDSSQGRGIFEKHCAACHQIDGVGIPFAPDISDSREKSAEQLLTDIIQPNRAIDSNYFSYTALTVDGLVHTGVLTAETSTSVTLKQAEGKSVTLRRNQIDDLRSDGVSFMPDGLEKDITPQEMADLIAYIKNWRYLDAARRSSD